MASSTGIPSSPSNASKSISLHSLWSDTQSNLVRLFRVNLRRSPPSSVRKSQASGSDSAIGFEISLPQQPECSSPRRCNKNTLVAILCPPVAVYRTDHDVNAKVWLTVALTLGGWIPGVVYAVLTAPARRTSPYYWHTAERTSSIVAKGPRRRSTQPPRKMVHQVV